MQTKKFQPSRKSWVDKTWLNKNIFGFGLASLMSDFGHEMTTAILPTFLISLIGFAQAPSVLGLMMGLSDAAASIAKLFSGYMSDKVQSRKPFLLIGYTCTAIFIALIGTAKTIWQILFYKTMAWIGRGFREPPRDAALTESTSQQYYGRAFGFQRAMDTAGAILGPLVALLLIPFVSLNKIFFISFFPGVIAVFVIIFFIQETKIAAKTAYIQQNFLKQFIGLPGPFLFFVFVMFIFGIGNFNRALLILYAQKHLLIGNQFLTTSATAIALYTLFNIVRAFGEYFIGMLSDFINRKLLLAFLGILMFSVLAFCMMYSQPSMMFLIILFILFGISTATITALEKALAGDLLIEAPHVRATGFGLLQTIDGIGDLISSALVGFLWTTIGSTIAFAYAALISTMAFVLLLMLNVKKKI